VVNATTREGLRGERHDPAALPPKNRHVTHFTEGWMVSREGLDGGRKTSLPSGFDPLTDQPVASPYTD
jgi:hypothetical protein